MMSLEFVVNGTKQNVEVPPDTPLLWVIREELGLKGTKFGCGMGLCGACTVHLGDTAIRSCITPVEAAVGNRITTIEGLSSKGKSAPENQNAPDQVGVTGQGQLHVLQEAWITHSVPQCGYCQSGQLMAAASLLAANPNPTDDEIKTQMAGNICRCGTYSAINAAIRDAAKTLVDASKNQSSPAQNEGTAP
jgi:isoquinoline 1-oxidoreductase alpha subunit